MNDNLCAALDRVSPRTPCCLAASHAIDLQMEPGYSFFCDSECAHRTATPNATVGLLAEFELDNPVLGSIPAARPGTLTCMQGTHPWREVGGNYASAYSHSPQLTPQCMEHMARCQYYKDRDLTTADSGICSVRDVAEIQSEAETDSTFRNDVCWAQADLQAQANRNFVEMRTQPPAIFETPEIMQNSQNPRAARVIPLTLAAWNVRSLLDKPRSNRPERRITLVSRELARYKVDIAGLSEIGFSEQGQLEVVGAGYTFIWSGRPKAE
ncbi:unnamed protein product [Schistocephalus solidus]|uniref:Uncharacterized protein n=1 Tax=Schistocephalus solidus TaxID=70667 RepID=A0A3P7CF33_SCHSO|nr:unnamed protein product [Schistocephalus solidus]